MKIIEILKILQKYGINDYAPCWAEHDIIGFCIDYELISQEDIETLNKLGCHYDDEYDGLVMFC